MWWLYAIIGALVLVILFLVVALHDVKGKLSRHQDALGAEVKKNKELTLQYRQDLDKVQQTIDRLYNENLSLKGELGETKVTAQGELHTADITGEIEKLKQQRV